jgi:hypothetical protein
MSDRMTAEDVIAVHVGSSRAPAVVRDLVEQGYLNLLRDNGYLLVSEADLAAALHKYHTGFQRGASPDNVRHQRWLMSHQWLPFGGGFWCRGCGSQDYDNPTVRQSPCSPPPGWRAAMARLQKREQSDD